MSQSPPDNPFGSQPPDDPFGRPPEEPRPQSAADIWRKASEQQQQPAMPPRRRPHPRAAMPGRQSAQKADGAITSLVLGIVGIVLCQLCAPFAWAMGRKAEQAVDASGGTLGGRGEATAGKILGIIGTVFLILIILYLSALIIWTSKLEL